MKNMMSRGARTALTASGLLLAHAPAAFTDHGPGTSGGGASTQSGETLKPGKFSIDLRTDYTEYDHLSSAQLAANVAQAGEFDVLDRSFVSTIGLSYGVVENFQVGLSLGYYNAAQPRSAEYDSGTGDTEINTFDPNGLTDLWLTGKYRFYRGPLGSIAAFGGVKFPTGRDDVRNSAGERLEPSATAGSGAYDGMLGLAWSRFLTSQFSFDLSAQYTRRGGRMISKSATASTRAWPLRIGSPGTSRSFRRSARSPRPTCVTWTRVRTTASATQILAARWSSSRPACASGSRRA